MHLALLYAALIALIGSAVEASFLPVTFVDGPQNQFIIRYVRSRAVRIMDARNPRREPYNVMFNYRPFHGRDIHITNGTTNKPVATLLARNNLNPFQLTKKVSFADQTGEVRVHDGKLRNYVFYYWNEFTIKLKDVHYKMMCGVGAKTCNIVAHGSNVPDKVVAVVTFGKRKKEYLLTVSRDMPIGVALLGGVIKAYEWALETQQRAVTIVHQPSDFGYSSMPTTSRSAPAVEAATATLSVIGSILKIVNAIQSGYNDRQIGNKY